MDQTQTPRFVSRFEPLLYVPAITQKDFQSTNMSTQDSHTGNLHWGFGVIQPRVHNSSLNQYNLSLEVMHNQNKYHLTQEG